MHFHYTELINRFKADLAAMTEAETKHHQQQLDNLYARESKNYQRYESALQRCRELFGKITPHISGELLDEVKIFHEIIADMLQNEVNREWLENATIEKTKVYREWLKKREEQK